MRKLVYVDPPEYKFCPVATALNGGKEVKLPVMKWIEIDD